MRKICKMPAEKLIDWILTCIGNREWTLRDLIAYIDYRNHAILTYEEFTAALRQLGRAGVVARRGNLLYFSESAAPAADIPSLFSKAEFAAAVNEYLSGGQ